MRVVVAPDSFKGSLDAASAASAIGSGWRAVHPGDEVLLLPQADGGEGTLSAITSAVPAARLMDVGPVTGPDGRPVEGHWLWLADGTAVVELALSSGLPLMAAPDPLGASTRGLGEVIVAALDAGATSLVIALGGSASTDAGTGALRALGLELFDAAGSPVPDGGGALARLARVDTTRLRAAPAGGVRLLSDVTAPLLGSSGAAAVFGPQKGASPEQVLILDAALARFAEVVGSTSPGGASAGGVSAGSVKAGSDNASFAESGLQLDVPGSGAAGGTGYGFLVTWGAEIEAGSMAIATLTGLVAAAASADVLITGEGRFDDTSLTGKVTGNALSLSTPRDARRALIVGSLSAPAPDGVWSTSLVELAGSLEAALDDPERWLFAAGIEAAHALGLPRPAAEPPTRSDAPRMA
jgi:glycerate kinase